MQETGAGSLIWEDPTCQGNKEAPRWQLLSLRSTGGQQQPLSPPAGLLKPTCPGAWTLLPEKPGLATRE